MQKDDQKISITRLGAIPLPRPRGARGLLTTSLEGLAVGEAVAVSGSAQSSVISLVRQYGNRAGRKLVTRKLEDGRTGVWRVE